MPSRLPLGVREYTKEETYLKKAVEDTVVALFEKFGFDRAETPVLDFATAFSSCTDLKSSFKFADYDGSLLVLRPDSTVQLAKNAVGNIGAKKTNRLYYTQKAFSFEPNISEHSLRETDEIGAVYFNDASLNADTEIIAMAIEICLSQGLKDFALKLGQADYLKGMIRALGLSADFNERLYSYLCSRSLDNAQVLLAQNGITGEVADVFLQIPFLCGGKEVFVKAQALLNNASSKFALESLNTIYNTLESIGFKDYISIDFAMPALKGYYSGTVFEVYTEGCETPLVIGGRFDGLCKNFGQSMPAIGLTVCLPCFTDILNEKELLKPKEAVDYAFYVEGGMNKYAYKFIRSLRKSGERVIQCPSSVDQSALREFCRQNNIAKLISFNGNEYEITEIKD